MDSVVEQIMLKLPTSKTELSADNIKKIHRYLPVPSDYKILWADILSFGGYPAGIVITDKGLIIKSTKEEVKRHNKEIKAKNKELSKEQKIQPLKGMYQIIPWEYYSSEEYEVVSEKDNKGVERFYIKTGDTELCQFSSPDLYRSLNHYKEYIRNEETKAEAVLETSTFSAINSYNTEYTMFNAKYGADTTKTGHGIYAEEAGSLLDKLSGEHSTVVGRDNAKNGPDKIVDSIPIQCKYYKTANGSVNACFKSNGAGGKSFRYYDLTGNPMKIEVPSDQFAQAVEKMKSHIIEGHVPGVSDPNAAYDIIRKGKLTYKQALNLAKAGTVQSITYDAVSGAISCSAVFGITSVVAFAQIYWNTKDYRKAAKSAILSGLQVYGLSFLGGIFASQIARTNASNILVPWTTALSEKLGNKLVSNIVNAFRILAGEKAIYGATAQKYFVKALSSNAITEGVMFIAFSVPDTIRIINGRISVAQYVKDMLSLIASFGGSIGGTMLTGAFLGGTVGPINKSVGKIVGFTGGAVAGVTLGAGTKAIANIFHEDDSKVTTRLFNAVLSNMLIDYMLSESEIEKLLNVLGKKGKELNKLQKKLLKSDTQALDISNYLTPLIETIVNKRDQIDDGKETELNKNIDEIMKEGDLKYEL